MAIGAGKGLTACLSVLVSGAAVAGEWGGSPPREAPTKPTVMEPLIYIVRGRVPVVQGPYAPGFETLVADTAPNVVEPHDAWQAP